MKQNLAVLLAFTFVAIFVTWPLILHPNILVVDPIDGLLNTWMLNWVSHSFASGTSGLTNFYNANIFYPYKNTFAFSDLQLPLGIIALPFVLLTGEPLLADNSVLLVNLVLGALAVYLLVKHLTGRLPIAFLAGILLGFSTIHLNYLAHQQSLSVWAVIFATLYLLKGKGLPFVFFFVIAVLITPLNLYFLLLIVGTYCFFNRGKLWPTMKLAIISSLLVTPFLIPFWLVSATFHYQRPITDAINFSLQFPDLANVSTYSCVSTLVSKMPGTPAYFGAVFLTLTILMLRQVKASMWIWIAGLSFILSLGPALHIYRNTVHLGPIPAIPLPYAVLYYLIPGFAGFRTPSRWIILTAFALSMAIAIYFAKKITWPWAIILSLLVILEVNFPFKYYRVSSVVEFPPEQVWLKDHYLGAPIIQFPIYAWFDGENVRLETLREYYSTIHWHPMFNGYSGFSPKEWEDRVRYLQKNFPNMESVNLLEKLGIKLILVPNDWDISCCQNRLKLVARFPNTKIYAFRSGSSQN